MVRLACFALAVLLGFAGPVLAVPQASQDYELAGSLADANGGPALTRLSGGTLGTAAAPGFTFGTNDGLLLSGISSASPYSIEMLFDFDAADHYFKIIDFANRSSDSGLYSGRGVLDLYPRASGSTVQLFPGALTDLLLTRSAAGSLAAYLNGVLSFSYDDSNTVITASGVGPLLLFADDTTTGGREATSGFVRRIRVFDSVLTPTDAADLAADPAPAGTTAVPEPFSAGLLASCLLVLAASRRRRPLRVGGR